MSDIIAMLKAEANEAPSRVSFRALGKPGDYILVKLTDNMGFSNNSYEWLHSGNRVSETQAGTVLREHLSTLNDVSCRDPDFYQFVGGHVLKREYGLVRLPKNDGIGVDAHGKWVLRDSAGNAVDMDKYRIDIIERYKENLGEAFEGYTPRKDT